MKPAAQLDKLCELLLRLVELGPGRLEYVARESAFSGAEQITYLAQREPQLPGPADEGKASLVGFEILPVTGAPPFRHGQQTPALVEAHRLNANSASGGEPSDCQPGHAHKLAPVPRYGVNWRGG